MRVLNLKRLINLITTTQIPNNQSAIIRYLYLLNEKVIINVCYTLLFLNIFSILCFIITLNTSQHLRNKNIFIKEDKQKAFA